MAVRSSLARVLVMLRMRQYGYVFDEMLRGARAKPVLFGRQGDGIASLEGRPEILRNHVLAGLCELAQDGAEQRRPRCPFAPASKIIFMHHPF